MVFDTPGERYISRFRYGTFTRGWSRRSMDNPDEPSLALVCSVDLEAEPVRRRMLDMHPLRLGRKPAWRGRLAGRRVVLLVGGMGKVNAAQAVTALLEARRVAGVIGFGVGGAYPRSGLSVGAVALATAEIYGDEGVATPSGWISTEEIGIPLLEAEGSLTYNTFPLDRKSVAAAAEALARGGIAAVAGPFVTVSCCSGTADRGEELRARFGAVCESMEGAAWAHVAALYGVGYLELRGISNLVEDRDLSGWRLADAAAAAAEGVEVVVQAWADHDQEQR